MNIKMHQLPGGVSNVDRRTDSTGTFIIVVVLLAIGMYLVARHAIPWISAIVHELLLRSLGPGGGVLR